MLYKFKLGYNDTETTKNICCAKGGGAVDTSAATGWIKKFCSDCKNLDDWARSGRPKIADSEAMVQASEVILVSST